MFILFCAKAVWPALISAMEEREKKIAQIEQFIELYRPQEPNPKQSHRKPAGFGRRKA